MELTARIHFEDGTYWAEVAELPGCFATGDTLDELFESLRDGIALYGEEGAGSNLQLSAAVLTTESNE